MSKLLRSLLAATAFLALAPTAASARPEDCDELCTDVQMPACSDLCLFAGKIITCGDYGYCVGAGSEPSSETASVAWDEASQSEAAAQVCSQEQQSMTPSASAEG